MESEEYSSLSFINKKPIDNLETDDSIITNPDYLINLTNNSISLSTSLPTSIAYMLRKVEKTIIKADLKQLFYNQKVLENASNERINSLCCANFKNAQQEDNSIINVHNRINGYSYITSFEKAKAYADNGGYTLFKDGNKIYIDDLDKYVHFKKKALLLHYRNTQAKLSKEIFYVSRNTTNTRMDHNLTSMCSESLKIIKKDNNLSEIDISNSQFAIHANWLKELGLTEKYEDIDLYYKLCTTGSLYLSIAYMLRKVEKTSPEDQKRQARKEVKGMMFNIVFSSHKSHSKAKDEFKKLFPNVMNHIMEFKKEHGSEQFANELSKREAKMFVDNIYPNLKFNGLWAITKHDSVIFKAKDKNEVKKIIDMYFYEIGFECAMEIEGDMESLGAKPDEIIEKVATNQPEEQEVKKVLLFTPNQNDDETYIDECGDKRYVIGGNYVWE